MCTLVVATRVWSGAPLVVAANRDEDLTRPAALPHHWARDDDPQIFAPRDLQAGGTWLGIRGAKLFVALTNRFTGTVPAPGPRSRGEIVVDALAIGDVQRAAEAIARQSPARHSPFHLLIADREQAQLVWNDGTAHHHEILSPGFHVISERSRGAAPTGRDGLLRRRLQTWSDAPEPAVSDWTALLSEHVEPPMEGPCVHMDSHPYGTRSATIVRLRAAADDDAPGSVDFFHADGPPCTAPFVDLSDQARTVS